MGSDSKLLDLVSAKRGIDISQMTADLLDLPDESLFENIDKASERIRRAIYTNQPMVIFGHDDPDGVTSTYILYRFLNALGYQKHQYYIPNRNSEMHGIQKSVIDYVRAGEYPLLITVDNGISSANGVEELKALGCDVIIIDHHLVELDQLPDAYAIVNPQLAECHYPFKSLAGVGVVLMFLRYLSRQWQHPLPESFYFWVTVGSLADKVPMLGVNWKIVRYVLDNWELMNDPAINFLTRNYPRIGQKTDIFNFMQYTSRLLANGRQDHGKHLAMDFLLQVGDEKAQTFERLESQKIKWESELNAVFRLMDSLTADFTGDAFVYYDDENAIPYSLLGTAASYVVNRLNVPTLMLKLHNGNMNCEGRSIEGFSMVEAFRWCKEYLIQYGGHVKAAGFTMHPDNYNHFIEAFYAFVAQAIAVPSPEQPECCQSCHQTFKTAMQCQYDAMIAMVELTPQMWSRLEDLMPFGQMFGEPVIRLSGASYESLIRHWTFDINGSQLPGNGLYDLCVIWRSPNVMKLAAYQEIAEKD